MQHQGQDKTQLPPLMSASAAAFKVAETKADNCWKPAGDQWERPTGGWQACVWSRGERGNRCLDRAAVIGVRPPPLWPDTSYRWLTAGRPCRAVRSRSGAQWELRAADIIYWLHKNTPDFAASGGSSWCYELFPLTNSYVRLPVTTRWSTALYSWDRKPYDKRTHCQWNEKTCHREMQFIYMVLCANVIHISK